MKERLKTLLLVVLVLGSLVQSYVLIYRLPGSDSVVQSKVYTETETQLQKLIAGKATPQEVADAIQKVQDAENAAAVQ